MQDYRGRKGRDNGAGIAKTHISDLDHVYMYMYTRSPTNTRYSQGAAIVHRAIEALTAEVRARIAGVVTFGDTQTLQDGGRVKGYPANQTLIICNSGDIICTGTLVPIYPVHWDYVKWVPTATLFLAQTVVAANAVDPWPDNGTTLAADLSGLGELGPGVGGDAPVPTRLVAFPEPPVATAG